MIIYKTILRVNDKEEIYYSKLKIDTTNNIQIKKVTILKNPIEMSQPRSLVIKGSFLKFNYDKQKPELLHIGITDSKNNVYHFWESYFISDTNIGSNTGKYGNWKNCLVIPIHSNLDDKSWDKHLNDSLEYSKKNHSNYNYINRSEDLSQKNDCYSFVIRTLNILGFNISIISLTEKFIQPIMNDFNKYYLIYNILKKKPYIKE